MAFRSTDAAWATKSAAPTPKTSKLSLWLVLGVSVLMAAGWALRELLFESLTPFRDIAAELRSANVAVMPLAEGSNVVHKGSSIATLGYVGGVQATMGRYDSLFVIRGQFVVPNGGHATLQTRYRLVGIIDPIYDWTRPIKIELVDQKDLPSRRSVFGRLLLGPPNTEFEIYVRQP